MRARLLGLWQLSLLSSKELGRRPQTGHLLELRSEDWSPSGFRCSRKYPQSLGTTAVPTDTKKEHGFKALLASVKNILHFDKEDIFLERNREGSQVRC